MKVAITKITPRMAQNWLDHNNPHNRALSESTVSKLVAAVKHGEFIQNGEPICFDRNGDLTNGQHRLVMITRVGKPFTMVVVTDLDPKAFTTYDTGKRRSGADVLSIVGEKNCPTLACAIQMVLQYQRNRVLGGHGSVRVSNSRLLDAWDTFDKEHMRRCVTLALRVRGIYKSTGILAACGYLVGPKHLPAFEKIVSDMLFGGGLVANDPVPALIRAIKDAQGHRIKLRTLGALTVQTMNARLRHKQVVSLHWNESEPFPVLLDHEMQVAG